MGYASGEMGELSAWHCAPIHVETGVDIQDRRLFFGFFQRLWDRGEIFAMETGLLETSTQVFKRYLFALGSHLWNFNKYTESWYFSKSGIYQTSRYVTLWGRGGAGGTAPWRASFRRFQKRTLFQEKSLDARASTHVRNQMTKRLFRVSRNLFVSYLYKLIA